MGYTSYEFILCGKQTFKYEAYTREKTAMKRLASLCKNRNNDSTIIFLQGVSSTFESYVQRLGYKDVPAYLERLEKRGYHRGHIIQRLKEDSKRYEFDSTGELRGNSTILSFVPHPKRKELQPV